MIDDYGSPEPQGVKVVFIFQVIIFDCRRFDLVSCYFNLVVILTCILLF